MQLLTSYARYTGLEIKTPLNVLPDDLTPEWAAARAALETAYDALDAFDSEHDDYLSEDYVKRAEAKEHAYMAAITSGGKPPARPRGGYVVEAHDKAPGIVAQWRRLVAAKNAADTAAWKVFVRVAPLAVPDAHAAIVEAGETYIAAEEAANKARDAFVAAFSYRRDLEIYASGDNHMTGNVGLPADVRENISGTPLPASIVVPRAITWLTSRYGPADTGGRLPAMRRVRSADDADGATLTVPPQIARSMESTANGPGIVYVDGYPAESEIRRNGAARMEVATDGE